MAVFKYVPRGEQTAQGKQKAYFCAHPDDYGKYFDKIKDEILGTLEKENNRNCAFFYLEDANAERDDDFRFSFKEMNLIVMPVTTRLLTTANPALDIEFRLAAEYGIPVLPIMMESGLADVFNAKCGDLQYLDPNSRDVTEISYEEKLTKYLTSVLIGDELAEKIRKAFDAYIFLSYRKKDRKYAQELMRLIHKNDFCRDIAIWYDEFLTPGEDFNKSIEDALNKSKLFALAVTPSLLEKGKDKDGKECENYIVAKEYPMAKKRTIKDEKFSILPAEIVETDKTALAEKYKDIPSCVSVKDESALTKSLETALDGIALRENDDDPEHNYLIGLAYLSGIDVEKDKDCAIKLITSAAEADLPEAMERLALMYRDGEKVVKCYDKSIEWQKKLVAYRKKEYLKKQDEDAAFAYLYDIWTLGDYIYKFRIFDEADEVYDEIPSISEDINKKFCTNSTLRRYCELALYAVSENFKGIADKWKSRGALEKAEEYYRKSLKIDKKLVSKTSAPEAQFNVSEKYIFLGEISHDRGNLKFAEKHYRQAVEIRENLSNGKDARWITDNLLPHYEKLGDICCSLNEFEDAEKYYHKSLGIREKLASATTLTSNLHKLSDLYDRLGYLYQSRGIKEHIGQYYFGQAEKYYQKELSLLKKIAGEKEKLYDKSEIARCYDILGNVCQSLGKFEAAKDYFSQSIDISESIVKKIHTGKYYCFDKNEKNDLYNNRAVSLFNMAFAFGENKTEYLNEALDIWTQLAEQIPDVPEFARRRDIVKQTLGIK